MPQNLQLYSIERTTALNSLNVAPVFNGTLENDLPAKPTAIVAADLNGAPHLIVYDQTAEAALAYTVREDGTAVVPAGSIEIKSGWTHVEPFVIGNQPHLMCYRQSDGIFGLHPLTLPLRASAPYRFYRNHEPGITKGFTTVKPFTAGGTVCFLGYCQQDGRVAIYTLSVTATSAAGLPPLFGQNVWAHVWARGWTHFAFFQFGGENFFFKINIDRPNVNIDHIVDSLSGGSVEVCTHMKLPGATKLDIVQPLILAEGEPYFMTYLRDGTTTVNRFHADCQGWTAVATFRGPSDAAHLGTVSSGGSRFVLFA